MTSERKRFGLIDGEGAEIPSGLFGQGHDSRAQAIAAAGLLPKRLGARVVERGEVPPLVPGQQCGYCYGDGTSRPHAPLCPRA